MSASRWWWRAGVAAAIWVGCLVAGSFLELDPHPVRSLLLIGLLIALSGLLADSVIEPSAEWHRDHPDREDWRGHDERTAFYVRMLESHLTGRAGDPTVRDRLVRLAEARGGHVDPPVHLGHEALDHWIGRIERL